eukprot:jgi/Mesvir1/24175/Mv10892-RA.1
MKRTAEDREEKKKCDRCQVTLPDHGTTSREYDNCTTCRQFLLDDIKARERLSIDKAIEHIANIKKMHEAGETYEPGPREWEYINSWDPSDGFFSPEQPDPYGADFELAASKSAHSLGMHTGGCCGPRSCECCSDMALCGRCGGDMRAVFDPLLGFSSMDLHVHRRGLCPECVEDLLDTLRKEFEELDQDNPIADKLDCGMCKGRLGGWPVPQMRFPYFKYNVEKSIVADLFRTAF